MGRSEGGGVGGQVVVMVGGHDRKDDLFGASTKITTGASFFNKYNCVFLG